jgi:hypothetical protein
LNGDEYLETLGALMVRTIPLDQAIEILLTERPGGDAQIQRLQELRSQLTTVRVELDALNAVEPPLSKLQILCQSIFRHQIEGYRLLELAVLTFVETLFHKSGEEFAQARAAQSEAMAWIDIRELSVKRPDIFHRA